MSVAPEAESARASRGARVRTGSDRAGLSDACTHLPSRGKVSTITRADLLASRDDRLRHAVMNPDHLADARRMVSQASPPQGRRRSAPADPQRLHGPWPPASVKLTRQAGVTILFAGQGLGIQHQATGFIICRSQAKAERGELSLVFLRSPL
jgi:hypothetical protein